MIGRRRYTLAFDVLGPASALAGRTSDRGTHCVAALGVEEQQVLKRNGEPLSAARLEPRLERKLGDDLGLTEPQVRELLVTEVLDHLDRGLPVRAVRLPVTELHVLGTEPDELS